MKKNFERNFDKFSEGEHYFWLKGEKLRKFKNLDTDCPIFDKREHLYCIYGNNVE